MSLVRTWAPWGLRATPLIVVVLAQSIQDDLEQVARSAVPFALVEAGQVADEEDFPRNVVAAG